MSDLRTISTFRTGQIAAVVGVATKTVSNWIDKGLLPGFRLPDSTDRRVTRENLEHFLKERGLYYALEKITRRTNEA